MILMPEKLPAEIFFEYRNRELQNPPFCDDRRGFALSLRSLAQLTTCRR
jgi:hypothetical protein